MFALDQILSMSEPARSVIFNEDIYNSLTEKQRVVFIYQWLCYLHEVCFIR